MKLNESNIQGVGAIPSHWNIKKLKHCLLPGSEGIKIGPFGSALKSEILITEGYKVYGQENLIKDDFTLGHRFISEEKFNELKSYEIIENDVLISMMGTVGKCKVVPSIIEKGIMDSHLIRIRFNESIILPEFAAYLIQDSIYIKVQIDLNSKGSIMSGLNSSIIKNLKLILPPIEEQRIILKYISRKNMQLYQLSNSKNILINLLNEQRQSIITEAVTKGLNPNVKMKNSGIEWIGEIPEHWDMKKVKYTFNNLDYKRIPLSSEERGKMTEKVYDYYGASGVIDKVDYYLFDETLILIGEDGANLFSRSTPLAFLARGKYWVNNHAHILKPKNGDIDYFVNLLESIDYSIYISGSAQLN